MKCSNRKCNQEIESGQPFHTDGKDDYCDDVCAAFEGGYRLEDQIKAAAAAASKAQE